MNHPDYSLITESPGLSSTAEQLQRIYHRYHFAKSFCEGKDVIEVACGSGMGLGYLATFSNSVVGLDIDEKNLLTAQQQYQDHSKIKIINGDAHHLPLANGTCDVAILYEAIYYLKEPDKFIAESKRVLKANGVLIICTVNKDWKDFHPSPYVFNYFSVPEIYKMVKNKFNDVKIYGAFKVEEGIKHSITSLVKRVAIKLNMIPGSLCLRAYLKRIFIGRTFPLPAQIHDGITDYTPPVELPVNERNSKYKILYIVGRN